MDLKASIWAVCCSPLQVEEVLCNSQERHALDFIVNYGWEVHENVELYSCDGRPKGGCFDSYFIRETKYLWGPCIYEISEWRYHEPEVGENNFIRRTQHFWCFYWGVYRDGRELEQRCFNRSQQEVWEFLSVLVNIAMAMRIAWIFNSELLSKSFEWPLTNLPVRRGIAYFVGECS